MIRKLYKVVWRMFLIGITLVMAIWYIKYFKDNELNIET